MNFEYQKVKVVGVTKPLVEGVDSPEDLIVYMARVSNPSNQLNMKTAKGLLDYCKRNAHWSIFGMVNIQLEVETTRDIGRQLLRHSSIVPQEFCIAGDSKVKLFTNCGRSSLVKIEDLYKRYKSKQYWGMSHNLVKTYDEKTKCFVLSKIKEVFYTGNKECFEIETACGKTIKATKDHKFLTRSGFKKLEDIKEGDVIGVNGEPLHQNKEILSEAKQASIEDGTGLLGISEKLGTSTHTIRKWLKRHNICFSKKEVASYTEIWNKGLEKELQPRFGKVVTEETRLKQKASSKSGASSLFYKGAPERLWELEVRDYWYKRKNCLIKEQNGLCNITKTPLTDQECDIDHIKPLSLYPELAYDRENIQVILRREHIKKTVLDTKLARSTAKFSIVKSINNIGFLDTYDLEVEHESHNYVANGLITHNSQRYADPTKDLYFVCREARMQDEKNRQNSTDCINPQIAAFWEQYQKKVIETAKEAYQWAIENGIAKEQARTVLPEGNTMSRLYLNANIRSLIHYCEVRLHESTQKEHRDLAEKIWNATTEHFPNIFNKHN
jgi:thymidylate synthase (FAD)